MRAELLVLLLFVLIGNIRGQFIGGLPDTLLICSGSAVEVSPNFLPDSVIWSNGSYSDTVNLSVLGLYWYQAFKNGVSISDTFYLTSNQVYSAPSSDYFNTANNGIGGTKISGFDEHWEFSDLGLNGPYFPATIVSNPTSAWYTSLWPTSDWISGSNTGYHLGNDDTSYYFRNIFNIPCANGCGQSPNDSGNYCLDLEYYADNFISEVYINGIPQFAKYGIASVAAPYNHYGFTAGFQRSIKLCDDFKSGVNEMIVVLRSSPYAYGFLCQANPSLINTPLVSQDTVSLVACDSLIIDGVAYTSDTITIAYAIDSTNSCVLSYARLDVIDSYSDSISVVNCDVLSLNGMIIDLTGIYKSDHFNVNGCDSVIWINYTRLPSSTGQIVLTNCDSVVFNNQVLFSDTTISFIYPNVFGCDSNFEATIIVHQPSIDTLIIESCDAIVFGNNLISNTGWYANWTTTVNGCDSIIYLNYMRLLGDSTFNSTTACDSAFVQGLGWVKSSYLITDTLSNIYSCDSIHTRQYIVAQQWEFIDSVTSCSPIIWLGTNVNLSGTYIDTAISKDGCDSINTLHFIRLLTFTDTNIVAACDSAIVFGIFRNNSGWYIDSSKTSAGCDSTCVVKLVLNKTILTDERVWGCERFMYLGSWFYENDTVVKTFNSSNGCDSVHSIYIIIDEPKTTYILDSLNICFKELELIEKPIGYFWSNASDSPTLQDLDSTYLYAIIYIEKNSSCPDTIVSYANIEQCDFSIWIPNSFTPNNDGVNQQFSIGSRNLTDFEIQIFNRWGELVYNSNVPQFSFEPNPKNAGIQDAYTYVITFRYFLKNGMKSNLKIYRGTIRSFN